MATVTEFVGVYDADGGVRGEVTYVIGHMLGRAHCALCDITHSPVRRKPAWDEMVASLGVPVRLLHRNELHPERDSALASALQGEPLALIAARVDGAWQIALTAQDLDTVGGDVDRFRATLLSRVRERGWDLAAA
ncbi:hypothetical protein [uncultured Demequina sp.]|uniref:hypothetical protein n=1 Tax=uncultured Demequina sp. TaxID=693499 RepID=UPI0025D4F23F|nr:hypothetical protein [uncultured Demequina sp.]